jgi:phenylalanyl-tRNA synthetase beta chain
MKFSKAWLQEYIKETLPEDKVIEEELNAKAFEVEGIETFSVADGKIDSIFDIKVLPNRAHDALGHAFMARELCACLGLTFNNNFQVEIDRIRNNLENTNKLEGNFNFIDEKVLVEVMDKKACTRFSTIKIDGVVVGESPEFIKNALQSIGQKSINNIVDITNYVQFMLNKPMHAYDASNIEGGIKVRYASEGEKLVTLDDKELELQTMRKHLASLVSRGESIPELTQTQLVL